MYCEYSSLLLNHQSKSCKWKKSGGKKQNLAKTGYSNRKL